MKKLIIALALLGLSACAPRQPSAEDKQNQQTKQLMAEADRQVGMPEIVHFQEKKLAKMVMELRDKEDLVCYAYIKSDYNGKLVFIGKCLGYGIPYGVSFTNPDKIARESAYGIAVTAQAEPNGLYTNGVTSSATWLFMLDPVTSKPRAVYFEPDVIVSPFPLN